jgi:hypothetical protein
MINLTSKTSHRHTSITSWRQSQGCDTYRTVVNTHRQGVGRHVGKQRQADTQTDGQIDGHTYRQERLTNRLRDRCVA